MSRLPPIPAPLDCVLFGAHRVGDLTGVLELVNGRGSGGLRPRPPEDGGPG